MRPLHLPDRRDENTASREQSGHTSSPVYSCPSAAARTRRYAERVRVRVKLFAALRERAGAPERELELPEGASAADAWAAIPELGEEPAGLLYARNREYVPRESPLADGDELALIPPVSGGAFRLTTDPIDLGTVVGEVADERAGAIATFVGTTRLESRGRTVTRLEYEAYEGMAEQEMARIAEGLLSRYDLVKVAITHRIGRVEIGEASVAIAVSAAHRADALAACKDAIDTLKETVPLWKKEIYEGGEEWIGRGS
jgi:molybdopterin synthase catalytic subunit